MLALLFLAVTLGCVESTSASGIWGYGETRHGVYGPKDWGHVSEYCDASAQSPVDINHSDVKNGDHLRPLRVTFDKRHGRMIGTLVNNGHAPTFKVDKAKGGASLINPVNGQKYILQQFHFHFGCHDNVGSEHTVNGMSFAGELHLVFFNAKYGNLSNAATKSDGLTVIGVFLEKREDHGNKALRYLTGKLKHIIHEGDEVQYVTVKLGRLVNGLSSGKSSYYTYKGSLTTPGCYESVRWLVLKSPIGVDEEMLERFRALQAAYGFSDGKMCNNYRPTQPLNGRQISFFQ